MKLRSTLHFRARTLIAALGSSLLCIATSAAPSISARLEPVDPLIDREAFCAAKRDARNALCPRHCLGFFCLPDPTCVAANEAKYQNCLVKGQTLTSN
jgi:hypothetical protein